MPILYKSNGGFIGKFNYFISLNIFKYVENKSNVSGTENFHSTIGHNLQQLTSIIYIAKKNYD